MKFKIKETYLLLVIVIGLISLSVYTTYALFTASTTINDVVSFNATLSTDNNLIEYEMVTLSPGEVKKIEVNVNNTYSTSLYYGTWYQVVSPSDTSDIVIGVPTESANPSSGAIAKTSSITVIVGLANNSSKTAVINIGTIGSTTSNLNLPTTRSLVPAGFNPTVADLVINSFEGHTQSDGTFPIYSGYFYTSETCDGATVRFNQNTLKYEVSNITKEKNATCTIQFIERSTTTFLNNYLISLSGTTQGNGQLVNENGYRYEGKDPNNYIFFNNETWRIIGIFDSSSHGVSNTNLVKIIRNDSIGGYAWHKSNTNDWPNSSLYHLLNDYYYTATDGTSSTYCYQYSTTITGNCDYTETGLQLDYRKMIQEVTWYLGGPSSNSNPASTFYANERDATKIYSGRSASTTGNIGLMYASDYGYSVLSSSCARTINLGNYNTNARAGNAWLKKETYEWTITPNSDISYRVWRVDNTGLIDHYNANNGYASRPVLYLKSDVKYISGTGTKSDPYIIDL